MRLPVAEAVAATRAQVLEPATVPQTLLVQTDSRAIERGATFLALRGERFDGHAYVEQAYARGAACSIVEDAGVVPPGRAALVVADTLQAYLDLGALARNRVRGAVVGITGSTGKTTTKQFLLALLRGAGVPVTATPENENNEVGVAKFLCALDEDDARVAIVEMGARKYHDLDVLVAAARPDAGVLTNVGDAHLEIMGTRERIAETKWALPAGARQAVLNLGDEASLARAKTLREPAMWFGIDGERPPPGQRGVIVERDAASTFAAGGASETHPVAIGFPGDHNRRNLAAALAAAQVCCEQVAPNVGPAALAAAVAALHLPHGRYEFVELAGDVRLVFDAYNASLSGTVATLGTFAREKATRRIAVLGGMAELGSDAPAMHERIGELAARLDVVLTGGLFGDDIARGVARAGGHAVRYATNADAVRWLRANVVAGDVILLKGSRLYKMEEIAAALGAEVFA